MPLRQKHDGARPAIAFSFKKNAMAAAQISPPSLSHTGRDRFRSREPIAPSCDATASQTQAETDPAGTRDNEVDAEE
jgi:hypothetical protein